MSGNLENSVEIVVQSVLQSAVQYVVQNIEQQDQHDQKEQDELKEKARAIYLECKARIEAHSHELKIQGVPYRLCMDDIGLFRRMYRESPAELVECNGILPRDWALFGEPYYGDTSESDSE